MFWHRDSLNIYNLKARCVVSSFILLSSFQAYLIWCLASWLTWLCSDMCDSKQYVLVSSSLWPQQLLSWFHKFWDDACTHKKRKRKEKREIILLILPVLKFLYVKSFWHQRQQKSRNYLIRCLFQWRPEKVNFEYLSRSWIFNVFITWMLM